MATVYSKLLCEFDLTAFVGPEVAGPPTGSKWVVRDIIAYNPNRTMWQQAGVLQCMDDFGNPIFILSNTEARGSTQYHWSGHQVIEEHDHLNWFTFYSGWQVRVSGYELKLP